MDEDGVKTWRKMEEELPALEASAVSVWVVVLLRLLRVFSGYRKELLVRELMVFSNGEGYYICPRCHVSLSREFVCYCDRCGQHLGWHGYKKVKVIYLH